MLENVSARLLAFGPHLGMALLYLLAFWLVWKVLNRSLQAIFSRAHLDVTIRGFILELVKYGLMMLGCISALGELGINTISLLTSLGVLGLTLGFAAKDTLSNLIAGLFIFWDRPFRNGDLVEIDGHYGQVQQITLRSTRIVTPDGKMLAFPNTSIVSDMVVSYTNFPHLRLDIPITIGVGEDIGRVRTLILEAVRHDPNYLAEPAPEVVVTALNDYNLALQAQVWIADERRHISLRHALREKLFVILRAAGIEMPFETLQVLSPDSPAATTPEAAEN